MAWLLDHGRWTLCHFEHGQKWQSIHPFNNNGTEGISGRYKTFNLGSARIKTASAPRELVASTCSYMSQKSEEQWHEHKKSLGTSDSLRGMPSIQPHDITKLKKMNPFAIHRIVPTKHLNVWNAILATFMEFGSHDASLYERFIRSSGTNIQHRSGKLYRSQGSNLSPGSRENREPAKAASGQGRGELYIACQLRAHHPHPCSPPTLQPPPATPNTFLMFFQAAQMPHDIGIKQQASGSRPAEPTFCAAEVCTHQPTPPTFAYGL